MTSGSDITEAGVVALAAAVGLTVPAPCLAGVAANLALLADHTALLESWDEAAAS